jgi:dolichyl-phosphate-mannose-protein mannosyltransferase
MVAAALAYLTHFIDRGWIGHDEGMLAQSAERVLLGQIPHVGYEEPYTGGLSWIYAALFRFTGIELLHVRWLLYVVAVVAMYILYALLRRFLKPLPAGVATCVGLAWSFPNYFAGLPSWWLLLCALGCVWALLRFIDEDRLRYVALAGIAAGCAVAIKQTGVYLPAALVLTLLYWRTQSPDTSRIWRIAAAAAAIASALLVAAILGRRLFAAEGLYLFLPVAFCSAALLVRHEVPDVTASTRTGARLWLVLATAALVPVALLLVPYALNGHFREFFVGAWILPRKRLAFATQLMPSPIFLVTGIPVIGLFVPVPQSMFGPRVRATDVAMWVTAIVLPILALSNMLAYQVIWQSTRALGSFISIAICYRLITHNVSNARHASMLYGLAAVLSWMSLNQFPYAGPIYFLYVAPLAVIASIALGASTDSLRRHAILPWTLMILLFALLCTTRSYVWPLGVGHYARHFDTPLNLPRAHLQLEQDEATIYRRSVDLIEKHLKGGRLVAGPDTPELYFLTATYNDSGRLFEFFSGSESDASAESEWHNGQVIVVNHRPEFSPRPTPELLAQLRRDFPSGELVDRFEVRWR